MIDPYGIFNMPRCNWLNETKPAAATKVRIAKPYQVTDIAPKTIIMGNSRPEMGLSPNSRCWDESMKPVFNLAIPGLGFYAQTRYLQHALESSQVKQVYFAVDFMDFTVNAEHNHPLNWPPTHTADFENRLLIKFNGKQNSGHFMQALKDKSRSLFTLNSLTDSLKTVFTQGNLSLTTRTRYGANFAQDYYRKIIKNEGQSVLFEQKNKEVLNSLSKNRQTLYRKGSHTSESLEALKRIKTVLAEKGIQATFFINPYHADYLNNIKKSGNIALFQEWKKAITEILSQQPAVTLYDFSKPSHYITEPPPQRGDLKKELNWFWEPAHYKQELGDVMLGQMLDTSCTENPYFGEKLSPKPH